MEKIVTSTQRHSFCISHGPCRKFVVAQTEWWSNSPLKAGRSTSTEGPLGRMLQEVVCRFLEVLLQSTKGEKYWKIVWKPVSADLKNTGLECKHLNEISSSQHTGCWTPPKKTSQGRGDEISLQTKILCTRSFPDVVTQNSRYLSSLVTLKVICTVRSSAWRHNKTLLWTCVWRWSRFKNAEID